MLPRAVFGVVLIVAALAAAAPLAAADEVPSPWTWTDYGPDLRDVSCAAPGDCVAVGQQGMVLRSTPGADAPLAWSRIPLDYPEELAGVTCNKSFCLAVSSSREETAVYASKVFRSDDGGATWSDGVELPEAVAGKAKTRSAIAIACDGGGDCYAVGPDGGIWRSPDGGHKWAALDSPPGAASYDRVACPAAATCVAVGGTGKGDESSVVIDGAKVTDVKLPVAFGAGINGLACDTEIQCTATDGIGNYASISIPKKQWGAVRLFPKGAAATALACPAEDVCVGLSGGVALRTVNLSAAAPQWKKRPLGSLGLGALDCAGADCVAAGKKAAWFVDFDDGFDWRRLNEVAKFSAIDCPAAFSGTCVAGGEESVGVSRTQGRLWSLPMPAAAALSVKAVNCSGESECLILGKNEALFTTNLEGFAGRRPPILEAKGTDAQTCITRKICVGINGGNVYTTLDGALTDWTRNDFPGGKPAALACVPGQLAPAECLAVAGESLLLGTMTHDDDQVRWNWRFTDTEPSEKLAGVGCSPGGECVAVGPAGEILQSDGTHLMDWSEFVLPSADLPPALRPEFDSVTCPADGVCLVGGKHGDKAVIASTTNHWADFSLQEIEGIEGASPAVEAFGCESVDRCVGVGGTSLVGVRKDDRPHR